MRFINNTKVVLFKHVQFLVWLRKILGRRFNELCYLHFPNWNRLSLPRFDGVRYVPPLIVLKLGSTLHCFFVCIRWFARVEKHHNSKNNDNYFFFKNTLTRSLISTQSGLKPFDATWFRESNCCCSNTMILVTSLHWTHINLSLWATLLNWIHTRALAAIHKGAKKRS